ncbi:MAG TPA: ABC transporter ATP-binding protein [Acidimicrobiales bacterium]|jgi:branched-chain amino acid transport system ATP-binding protein|nr:ABC transporter ATP-binding protein [Acidimicrobiales bacterium]
MSVDAAWPSPTANQAPVRPPALQLENIAAAYGKVAVLRGIDLTVAPGQVFALLGPNGAGKSTTLRVVSGRLTPASGRVLVDGTNVVGRSPERLARAGICSVPEGRGVFPNLTVAENLRMWTFRGGLKRAEVEEAAYARFPRLSERRKQMAGTLSGGEQQMLAMSRALATKPKLLLLDEISMGLAPLIVAELYELVGQIAKEGFAILLVEQFAATALSVAQRAAVMVQGRIEMEGTPAEIQASAGALYLGTGVKS